MTTIKQFISSRFRLVFLIRMCCPVDQCLQCIGWILSFITSNCVSCWSSLDRYISPKRYTKMLRYPEDEESGLYCEHNVHRNLTEDIDELRMSLNVKEEELRNKEEENSTLSKKLQNFKLEIDRGQTLLNDLNYKLKKSNETNYKLNQEKEVALSRLSELMGDKLRDNNPAITNLNDPNRPMKLGDQFSELYENEWTDAFTDLNEVKKLSETEAIKTLLDILKEISQRCAKEVDAQLLGVQNAMQNAAEFNLSKSKDRLKSNAAKYMPTLIQKISQEKDSSCLTVFTNKDTCLPYIQKCVQICYFAELQDPPMFINFEPGDKFDKQCFKEYTKSGTMVEYLVWPAFYLHKDGPLMTKGVVQPQVS